MTHKEITRALECCAKRHSNGCCFCPINENGCIEKLAKNALDLVNYQQSKIEELTFSNNALKGIKTFLTSEREEEIRVETIKEFVAKLKEHKCSYDLDNYHSFEAIDVDDINDAVKEFLGEDYDR